MVNNPTKRVNRVNGCIGHINWNWSKLLFDNQMKKFSAGLPSNFSLCTLVGSGMTSILVHLFIIIYDEGHSWGGNMPELHALPIITLLAALLAQWLCMPGRSRLLSALLSVLSSASSTSSAQLKLLPEFLVVCSSWSQSLRRQPTIWQRYYFILITIIIIIVSHKSQGRAVMTKYLFQRNPTHCTKSPRFNPRGWPKGSQVHLLCKESIVHRAPLWFLCTGWKLLYCISKFFSGTDGKNLKLETKPWLLV